MIEQMSLSRLRIMIFVLALGLASCSRQHPISKLPIPSGPSSGILDQAHALNTKSRNALQEVLNEHARLTGQRLTIGIFPTAGGGDATQRTRAILTQWKKDLESENGLLLLALFVDSKKADIETDFTLSSIFPEEAAKDIAASIRIGELPQNDDSTLAQAVYRILDTIQSPLIVGGQAQELLKTSGTHPIPSEYLEESPETSPDMDLNFGPVAWIGLILFGIILPFAAILQLIAREAHFTRNGWTVGWTLTIRYWKNRWSRTRPQNSLGGLRGEW